MGLDSNKLSNCLSWYLNMYYIYNFRNKSNMICLVFILFFVLGSGMIIKVIVV